MAIKKTKKKPTKKSSKEIISQALANVNTPPKKRIVKKKKEDRPWLFKKGQSGNPGGRKKGTYSVKSFKQILDKIGEEDILTSPMVPPRLARKFNCFTSISMKTGVMWVVYNLALSGKDWALRYIADYSEGKPKEFHEVVKRDIVIDIEGENHDDLPLTEEVFTNGDNNDFVTTDSTDKSVTERKKAKRTNKK